MVPNVKPPVLFSEVPDIPPSPLDAAVELVGAGVEEVLLYKSYVTEFEPLVDALQLINIAGVEVELLTAVIEVGAWNPEE